MSTDGNRSGDRDRILAITGGICAVAGVPAVLVAGRPYSSLVLLATLIILPVLLVIMIFRGRWKARPPHIKRLALVAAILVYASLGALVTIQTSRNFFLFTLLQLPGGDKPRFSQITVPEGEEFRRIRVVARNPSSGQELITHLTIKWEPDRVIGCSFPGQRYYYRLEDRVRVTRDDKRGKTFDGSVIEGVSTEENTDGNLGRMPSVSTPATGLISGYECPGPSSSLNFDVTIPFEANSFAVVEVDIPKYIQEDGMGSRVPFPAFVDNSQVEVTATLAEGHGEITISETKPR